MQGLWWCFAMKIIFIFVEIASLNWQSHTSSSIKINSYHYARSKVISILQANSHMSHSHLVYFHRKLNARKPQHRKPNNTYSRVHSQFSLPTRTPSAYSISTFLRLASLLPRHANFNATFILSPVRLHTSRSPSRLIMIYIAFHFLNNPQSYTTMVSR